MPESKRFRILHNAGLNELNEYPFQRLSETLKNISPPKKVTPIDMSIGEPSHNQPKFIKNIINQNYIGWQKYPPTIGTLELRKSCVNWLNRRYNLDSKMLNPEKNILPVAGTRDGLFSIALAFVNNKNTKVFIPNPFYQVYIGAAIISGAKFKLLKAKKNYNFLPNLEELDKKITCNDIIYICSPSNPQGRSADIQYWKKIISIARKSNSLLIADECYSEIYTDRAPIGILEACKTMNKSMNNIIAFHSLSKRSNAPGLRSGFAVGDPDIIRIFIKLRRYMGGQVPLPIQSISAALWDDDFHVEKNRQKYKNKFEHANQVLHDFPGYYKPDGGFYLWLDVKDGINMTKKLWSEEGVKVLPGLFLGNGTTNSNPGKNYIRIAMVPPEEECAEAIDRIAKVLKCKN